MSVLQSATAFLQELASLQPEVNVGAETPSALNGFFSVVTQLGDLGEELATYIEMVGEGMLKDLISHLDIRLLIQHYILFMTRCSSKFDST